MSEGESEIPATKEIMSFCHCGKCFPDRPSDMSPADWMKIEVGFTPLGIQVWCKRCEVNVMHIDFQGAQHPANTRTAT